MKKVEVSSDEAPQAIGPYSQAVKAGNFIFCAGQVGKDPKTNKFVEGGIEAQTKQVLKNLESVLNAAGAALDDVVKTNVYLQNVEDFPKMNEVYAKFFEEPYPARATIEAGRLPQDALVEIDCIAQFQQKGDDCCGGGCGSC